ncbi:MAG: AbrB/MazE/SpoVT family DNA-binding domain-containing protein [Chloroflexota bacterium]|nr:AbrB/MazE/SpoVT family DNA-binding domain-containing protein [Chloroflexota bacterium]MDE2961679.1 AbrB/MazE/SpoVT family DNA-binding domain-containing protein [Chloroflexota bacterium]
MAIEPKLKISTSQGITTTPVAVLTGENQITVPEGVLADFPDSIYFEITAEGGRIILTPIEPAPIEEVWAKIAELGITEQDVADAVQWARGR